jgi:hypothetical protein
MSGMASTGTGSFGKFTCQSNGAVTSPPTYEDDQKQEGHQSVVEKELNKVIDHFCGFTIL